MPNKTHRAPPRYKIPDFFSSLLGPLLHATQIKLGQHKGKFRDAMEEADNDARLRALDIALQIKGKYAPPATEQHNKTYGKGFGS
jgi:hypothetical protein